MNVNPYILSPSTPIWQHSIFEWVRVLVGTLFMGIMGTMHPKMAGEASSGLYRAAISTLNSVCFVDPQD
jgi:hypothetical protein